MITPRGTSAVLLLIFLAAADAAAGSCPSITATPAPPYVTWDALDWNYTGSLSTTGMSAAMSAWNAAQTLTALSTTPGGYGDIAISDDTTIVDALGTEQSFNYGNGGSACYLHPSATCSNLCFTTNQLYYADIKLNPNTISSTATDYNLSVNTVVQEVVAHELGHMFGLKNYDGSVDCSSPTIMSVNEAFGCSPQFFGPQTCDSNAVLGVYTGHAVWSWSICGPYCDLTHGCSG